MTRLKTILCVLIVVGSVLPATAQQKEINFTSLTTEDGLSSNTVNAIIKDRYGMIWLGTEDGLDKFDGTHFTVYRHNPLDTASLQANEILSLHEDKGGNLWIGTSGGSLHLYDRKKDCFIHFPSNGSPNTIRNNVIFNICSDYRGKIWIAHYEGVDILDSQTKLVSQIPLADVGANPLPFKTSMCLFEDDHRQMWIGTPKGLFKYDQIQKSLVQFVHSDKNSSSLANDNINAITEDHAGNLWIATNAGLSQLNPKTNRFTNFLQDDQIPGSLSNSTIRSVAVDGNNLWIATMEGLNIMDLRSGAISKFQHNHRNIQSLTATAVRCVYIDKEGIYWLGTIRGGVDKYDKNLNLFNYVRSNCFDEKGLNAPVVTAFEEAGKDKVFVGTDNKGMSLFDLKTNLFHHFSIISKRRNIGDQLSILALKMNQEKQLMIGTFADGLIFFDPVSGHYQQLMQDTGRENLNSNDIYCVAQFKNGDIWVGTNGEGINVLNQDHKVIIRYTPNPTKSNDFKLPINGYIRVLKESRTGEVWIGTHGGGIAVLHPASGKFIIYNTNNSNLPNDKIQSILEDSQGTMWVGTLGGGLAMFDKKNNQFLIFSERDGLQNSAIYKIIEDQAGLIWFSTNKGISSINPKTKEINNYTYHNGLQKNNFLRGSGILLSNGELFFGGLDGFNYFHPDFLAKNNNVPAVVITDLRISNQSVKVSKDGPLQEQVSVTKEINLAYKQNFAFDFVGISYTAPEQNRYAYKLEGLDKDWNYVGSSTTAAYTNLDPGKYIFRVKASNNDGIWNNEGASIIVNIHPPFWRTTYAYLSYAILLIGTLFYIRHRGIQKIKRRYALEQEKARAEQENREAQRIHELDRLKIKFLTNLSHEFRTPISLILGPVDTLIAQQKQQTSFYQLDIIKRNARRLLNLVNQLLDFRKMEEQELKVHVREGELVSFLRDIYDSFKDLAVKKHIHYAFNSSADTFHTFFDHDKLERILFNVLSNAFKFTTEEGNINLELERADSMSYPSRTWFRIKVSDTGIGIPEDKKEKIFEVFYQSSTDTSILNQGTGIGLSITKEFVKMMDGTISVESKVDSGTTFTILLPFTIRRLPAVNAPLLQEILPAPLPEQEVSEQLPDSPSEMLTVLLVEDNEDFRFYLKDNLRLHYKVIEAANGIEGWQKALAHHPQLIVSDINMPEMDGIAFSQKIKADKRTCHIPIILLTAMTGEEDQLKGLRTGANDYITKPFNVELLNAKIKNLLVLNSTLKNTYSKQIKTTAPEVEVHSADEKLLQKVINYLEEDLANPQLSVEDLSKYIGMSRSTLYFKLLELTGKTPVEYIRAFKLDKAAVLLEKSDMNVAEIAYSVGFSTPTYFSKSFKLKFNMLPSEYMNKMRQGSKKENNNK